MFQQFFKQALAMCLINGMNIDQVCERGLKFSEDLTEALIAEIENAARYILHHDLAYRNLMVEDCEGKGDVLVEAVRYVIDFGMMRGRTTTLRHMKVRRLLISFGALRIFKE